ncbi:AAA+-type ATPase [Elasticomyces elasticus]|nr:AAA+-type ATPase [Elasticomyces elasticus]
MSYDNLRASESDGEAIQFVVRPLPSTTASLDGAFRIHLTTRDLDALSLKAGDYCQVTCPVRGPLGLAIAWRAADPKIQNHPVKISDALRDAFSLKLGDKIMLASVEARSNHAKRIIIADVTDGEVIDHTKDDNAWKIRTSLLLSSLEVIAPGVAFEASSRKGLKKRFLVEHAEASNQDTSPCFYHMDDATELIIRGRHSSTASVGATTATLSFSLTSEGIGGLHKQLEFLNDRLERLIGQVKTATRTPKRLQKNASILLYGSEGTGKTLLLQKLAQAPWQAVLRIDKSALSKTMVKNLEAIRSVFAEAAAHQPSLIIIDDLDKIAGDSDTDSVSDAISREMDNSRNTQVLVVGATSNLASVNKSLRSPKRFKHEVEVTVPDMRARIEILKAFRDTDADHVISDDLLQTVGEKTHGFVGQDLDDLYERALDGACERVKKEHRKWVPVRDSNGNGQPWPDVASDASQNSSEQEDELLSLRFTDFEQPLLQVRPTAMREIFLETPKVQWSDIGGSAEVKQALTEVIEWPLKIPDIMAANNLRPQKGVLLYGPPGCSKTLTAQAIATSSGLNFIAVKGAELNSMYVGESERAVREVFRKARAAAPSIVFFDEIDAIGGGRDGAMKGLNVLTTLLNEMDGIETLKGVLVLAATNKPEALDTALLRPGRFDSLWYIEPPNQQARKEIFDMQTRRVSLAGDVDTDRSAAQTEGYSGAEIVSICQKAAQANVRRYMALLRDGKDSAGSAITMADYQAAICKTVKQITPEMLKSYVKWRDGTSA